MGTSLTQYRRPPNPVYLTSETSWELFKGLPSDKICGSIRDAYTLAIHLGVIYVWVDTLVMFLQVILDEVRLVSDFAISVSCRGTRTAKPGKSRAYT